MLDEEQGMLEPSKYVWKLNSAQSEKPKPGLYCTGCIAGCTAQVVLTSVTEAQAVLQWLAARGPLNLCRTAPHTL